MIKWLLNMVCWLVLVTTCVFAGCKQQYRQDMLASEPDIKTFAVKPVPNYAYRAIETTGRMQAWTNTKKFQLDCVVTFYQPDGSFYLTEQYYEIYPWSNSIRISAREPQGRFVWQLSRGKFTVLEGVKRVNTLPIAVCQRYLAEAILNLTTASVRFLDESFEFARSSRPVRIEGLWYYPIERTISAGSRRRDVKPYWSKVIFYQSRDTSLVDMLWFADVDEGNFFAVRGYDYHEVGDNGIRVPTRIEIFRTDPAGASPQRIVRTESFLKVHSY